MPEVKALFRELTVPMPDVCASGIVVVCEGEVVVVVP
jgi:hypothetical protein